MLLYLITCTPRGYAGFVDRIDSKIEALRHELRAEIHQSIRAQTWALATLLVAGLALFATIFGVLART
jgi:hypothetical protein